MKQATQKTKKLQYLSGEDDEKAGEETNFSLVECLDISDDSHSIRGSVSKRVTSIREYRYKHVLLDIKRSGIQREGRLSQRDFESLLWQDRGQKISQRQSNDESSEGRDDERLRPVREELVQKREEYTGAEPQEPHPERPYRQGGIIRNGNSQSDLLHGTLHEKEKEKGLKRNQFFLIFMVVSFSYYLLPGYMFITLTSMSWVCWALPNSVLAQQLGSGLSGLGLGSFSLDWSGIAAYLQSPLVSLWHAIANVMFFLDEAAYARVGPINMSTFFAFTYGLGFATITATVTHVALYHGRDIWQQATQAFANRKPDIHTRMMQRYPRLPSWWFLVLMVGSVALAIITVEIYSYQLQLPWWGVIFACGVAAIFTLPIGIITATTNITPGLNIVTEYMMGYILPGRPIANVCFKTYGYISMLQALAFAQDFKLGHYMKIPPRSMFVVQVVGTRVAAIVNMVLSWWQLTTIENICDRRNLPANSPWTCPSDRVFFDASVIWGLVGPKRIFGTEGQYNAMNWFWLVGFVAPVPFYLLHRMYPKKEWIRLINMPVLLGASMLMPPATAVNYISWGVVGFIFNFYVYRNFKGWWRRYNYVLSAALDAGVAFMGVALYLALQLQDKSLSWWGNNLDNCPLANCPTQPGVVVDGCPVF
ncbi:hypothetical protein R1flu_016184 [Riccia fluitans]|uniref:Oligopeptide transporter n=1 Tax=Riccia fluitans TaxID=41844 RepID=A0ABD1YLA4_9MARC